MSGGADQGGLFGRLMRWMRPGVAERKREQVHMDRRREVRVPVELRVAMRFESVDDVLHSRTVNVSEGGVFIRTRSPRSEGTRVRIQMEVGGKEAELTGMVVHRVTAAESGRQPPGMGVQFVNLTADARLFVDEILASAEH